MGLRCYLKLCLVVVCVPTQATNDTEAEVHLERPQCFLRRQIESTKFINDSQILFSVRAGGYFLNTLEKRCSRLGKRTSIAFDDLDRVCVGDKITVVERGFEFGSICRLGQFESVSEEDAANLMSR